jgi:hypothetical protein
VQQYVRPPRRAGSARLHRARNFGLRVADDRPSHDRRALRIRVRVDGARRALGPLRSSPGSRRCERQALQRPVHGYARLARGVGVRGRCHDRDARRRPASAELSRARSRAGSLLQRGDERFGRHRAMPGRAGPHRFTPSRGAGRMCRHRQRRRHARPRAVAERLAGQRVRLRRWRRILHARAGGSRVDAGPHGGALRAAHVPGHARQRGGPGLEAQPGQSRRRRLHLLGAPPGRATRAVVRMQRRPRSSTRSVASSSTASTRPSSPGPRRTRAPSRGWRASTCHAALGPTSSFGASSTSSGTPRRSAPRGPARTPRRSMAHDQGRHPCAATSRLSLRSRPGCT